MNEARVTGKERYVLNSLKDYLRGKGQRKAEYAQALLNELRFSSRSVQEFRARYEAVFLQLSQENHTIASQIQAIDRVLETGRSDEAFFVSLLENCHAILQDAIPSQCQLFNTLRLPADPQSFSIRASIQNPVLTTWQRYIFFFRFAGLHRLDLTTLALRRCRFRAENSMFLAGVCLLPDGSRAFYGGLTKRDGVQTAHNAFFKLDPEGVVECSPVYYQGHDALKSPGLVYFNDTIYLIGGYHKNPRNRSYAFSLAVRGWLALKHLPMAASSVVCLEYSNGILMTGREITKVYFFDPVQETYTPVFTVRRGQKRFVRLGANIFLLVAGESVLSVYGTVDLSEWVLLNETQQPILNVLVAPPQEFANFAYFIEYKDQHYYAVAIDENGTVSAITLNF